jgi:hypothetical protein
MCLCQQQELDDTSSFRNVPSKWGDDLEFPLPFGRTLTAAEEHIHTLDEGTGASLKFTVLNPKGRVWLMVAGGGASVIYAGEACTAAVGVHPGLHASSVCAVRSQFLHLLLAWPLLPGWPGGSGQNHPYPRPPCQCGWERRFGC